jgi:hypothetical protein
MIEIQKNYKKLIELFRESDSYKKIISNNFAFSCRGARQRNRTNKLFVHQAKKEIFGYLDFLSDKSIKSYLELGLEECANYYLISSALKYFNDDFQYAMGLDIRELSNEILESNKDFLNYKFCNCLKYEVDRNYDLIFIDTNQKYNDMKKTFDKYSQYCNKYIAFHDIEDRRYGAKRLFKELENQFNTIKWVNSGAGIGLVEL